MTNVEEFRTNLHENTASDPVVKALLDYSQSLETKIWLLERRAFGRSSEQYVDPRQVDLFNEAEATLDEAATDSDGADTADSNQIEEDEDTEVPAHGRKKRRAQIALSDHLPHEEQVHELSEDKRRCSCCNVVMTEIGEDVSKKLHVVPATVTVKKHVYKKYACQNKTCGEAPKQTPREPSAIPKTKATEETIAFIAVQKYLFSIPLYRLEYLFRNAGVDLSRYVMSLWMIKELGQIEGVPRLAQIKGAYFIDKVLLFRKSSLCHVLTVVH